MDTSDTDITQFPVNSQNNNSSTNGVSAHSFVTISECGASLLLNLEPMSTEQLQTELNALEGVTTDSILEAGALAYCKGLVLFMIGEREKGVEPTS